MTGWRGMTGMAQGMTVGLWGHAIDVLLNHLHHVRQVMRAKGRFLADKIFQYPLPDTRSTCQSKRVFFMVKTAWRISRTSFLA